MEKEKLLFKRTCALLIVVLTFMFCMPLAVFVKPARAYDDIRGTYNLGPAEQTLTLNITDSYSISYSGATEMFNGYNEVGISGSGVKAFNITSNHNASSRTGYILLMKNKKVQGRYKVVQDGVYLELTADHGKNIDAGGFSINYTVESNVKVDVYKTKNNGNRYRVTTIGSDQTASGARYTKTFSIWYPVETSTVTHEVRAYAYSVTKAITHTQSHNHNYTVVYTSKPTCTTNGAVLKECTFCHSTIKETIPATGHTKKLENEGNNRVDLVCEKCHTVFVNDVTYPAYLKFIGGNDNRINKAHYLHAVFNVPESSSNLTSYEIKMRNRIQDLITMIEGYDPKIEQSRVKMFCDSFGSAWGKIIKVKLACKIFGYDNTANLLDATKYINAGSNAYALMYDYNTEHVWSEYMTDTMGAVISLAGNAGFGYSTILSNLEPYLSGTICQVNKEIWKIKFTELCTDIATDCIDFDYLVDKYDNSLTPEAILKNMCEWRIVCKGYNNNDETKALEMYNMLFDAAARYYNKTKSNPKSRSIIEGFCKYCLYEYLK